MNQVIWWFNSKTWGGHNPRQNIIKLTKLVEEIHDGKDIDIVMLKVLVTQLEYINIYGYHLDDIVFKGSPIPTYKHKETDTKYLQNIFTAKDIRLLPEDREYERID